MRTSRFATHQRRCKGGVIPSERLPHSIGNHCYRDGCSQIVSQGNATDESSKAQETNRTRFADCLTPYRRLAPMKKAPKLQGPSTPIKEFKILQAFIDDIYTQSDRLEWSWVELSNQSGVGYSTVCRLGNYETMFPRFATVYCLARSVGMEMNFKRLSPKLKLAAIG